MIGFFVFRQVKDMTQVKDEEGKRRNLIAPTSGRRISLQRFFNKDYYNPFWYSLDLFLPFVDLKMADKWMPKPERRFARHYMRFQAIAGWILIPIAILSITGIVIIDIRLFLSRHSCGKYFNCRSPAAPQVARLPGGRYARCSLAATVRMAPHQGEEIT
jgi:hypothetical protein